jgi:predicted nuclease of predicted toxin-antitoxin system
VKLKLDENLGRRCVDLLTRAGHDVATVAEENLMGADDRPLLEACATEGRALVTLDLDFSNPLQFRPSTLAGIAVLRLPRKPAHEDLVACVATLVEAMKREVLTGRLWSVERGRVRVYQEPEAEGAAP